MGQEYNEKKFFSSTHHHHPSYMVRRGRRSGAWEQRTDVAGNSVRLDSRFVAGSVPEPPVPPLLFSVSYSVALVSRPRKQPRTQRARATGRGRARASERAREGEKESGTLRETFKRFLICLRSRKDGSTERCRGGAEGRQEQGFEETGKAAKGREEACCGGKLQRPREKGEESQEKHWDVQDLHLQSVEAGSVVFPSFFCFFPGFVCLRLCCSFISHPFYFAFHDMSTSRPRKLRCYAQHGKNEKATD